MRQLPIEFPQDVATLRSAIPELAHLPDFAIQAYYEAYSDTYAAGWLIVDAERIDSFRSWLMEDFSDPKVQTVEKGWAQEAYVAAVEADAAEKQP